MSNDNMSISFDQVWKISAVVLALSGAWYTAVAQNSKQDILIASNSTSQALLQQTNKEQSDDINQLEKEIIRISAYMKHTQDTLEEIKELLRKRK